MGSAKDDRNEERGSRARARLPFDVEKPDRPPTEEDTADPFSEAPTEEITTPWAQPLDPGVYPFARKH